MKVELDLIRKADRRWGHKRLETGNDLVGSPSLRLGDEGGWSVEAGEEMFEIVLMGGPEVKYSLVRKDDE